LGLGTLIENSVKAIQDEKAAIEEASHDKVTEDEDSLFDYGTPVLEDSDYAEFKDFKEEEHKRYRLVQNKLTKGEIK
jgi:hypothetical protein